MYISISKVNFTSIGINIAKVDFGRYDSGGEPQLNGIYITPADASAISVTPNDSYYTLHGKYLKYSLNGKKWKDWNGSVTIEPEQKMYLKGEDDYVWNSSTSGKLITSNGSYNVGGDISSLTNFITEVKEYTFSKLFYEDRYIKDASNLILPATTLADYCYSSMFSWCTSLTTAPELHANTLASYCYQYMFSSCTSLTTAPELPATTLANYCYSDMFSNCTSLTSAPALHATTLANRCYYRMFYDCKSLTIATELPATTLTDWCYTDMFSGCYSLTAAPSLPATTLAHSCYREMFYGCKSLTIAPELPATTLAPYCYYGMFQGCTSLITATELQATTLTDCCYREMFSGCSSLAAAPSLPATTLDFECYKQMFSGCSKLNSITMLATDISAVSCLSNWVNGVASTGTFTKAASMTSLPTGVNGIPEGWTVADSTDYMTLSALGDGEITITIPAQVNSSYATSLSYSKDKSTWTDTLIDDTAQTISIPVTSGENVYLKGIAKQLGNSSYGININSSANINASGNIMSLLYGDDYKDKVELPSESKYTFRELFKNNAHLINADELILPAATLTYACYKGMFQGCKSLTTSPELPATTLTTECYYNMFYGCTSLTTAPALTATTLARGCYQRMFRDCTSLTTAPELKSTKLDQDCYAAMFQGCSSLTAAPELPATELIDDCYEYMFSGCTSLVNAPELPATEFSSEWNCYLYMFEGCTSLTTAPELPATSFGRGCYIGMFQGCTSLTTAPALPATSLAPSCYKNMFNGCTSLTTAPELPATTLTDECYYSMFNNCTSLNNITMLATDISASDCLMHWVVGVAPTGTFTKSPEMTSLTTGTSGIPEGWTVVDYGAQPTFYGIRGTANVTSTTLTGAISFNDTNHDVHVDENGKWEIECNDPIYTSSNARSLCNSNNITSIDFRNTIWATRSQTNKDTFGNLFFDGSVSNLQDVYFDFTGQNTNDMCLESGIFSALTNCRIHGLGTLNWSGEIDVSNTTSKHVFSLREFNRKGIIGTLDLRGIDTTSITDQDVSSIYRTALSFDWTYGYWYLFPNYVYCDTIIIGSLEIQTDYFTSWYGPSDHCKTLYCTSPTPPSLSRTGAHGLTCYNWLRNLSTLQNIYVPVGCLDAYTNDPDWSAKASIISEKEAPDPLSI